MLVCTEYVSRKAGLSGCSEGSSQLIAGVVGASSSVTSIQVANLLKLFSIPQVGIAALSLHVLCIHSFCHCEMFTSVSIFCIPFVNVVFL